MTFHVNPRFFIEEASLKAQKGKQLVHKLDVQIVVFFPSS